MFQTQKNCATIDGFGDLDNQFIFVQIFFHILILYSYDDIQQMEEKKRKIEQNLNFGT